MRQIANGTKVGVKLKFLPQLNIDAGEAAAYRRGYRPLERDAGTFNRLGQFFGNVLLVFLEGFGASLNGFPFEFHAGRFKDTDHGLGDLSADAIAGDQCNFVSH